MRTTGTIHEVNCPYCLKPIHHIPKLPVRAEGLRVKCRKCRNYPIITKLYLIDEFWEMVCLESIQNQEDITS